MSGPLVETCPECGAVLPDGGSCRDHFHALLLLEWDIPGGPGAMAHFLAVATYGLQHPEGMRYTAETLAGLRASVADALDGRASIDDLRRRARRATNASSSARLNNHAPRGPTPTGRSCPRCTAVRIPDTDR